MCERVVRMAVINAGAICRAITSREGGRPHAACGLDRETW